MSNIYACPACERQYTVSNPGTYLCDCGAVFYCPEISDPDPKVVTQGIHRKQVLEKEPVQKLTADKLVSKSRVPIGKSKGGAHSTTPKGRVSVGNKSLEGSGIHNRKNLEASGSYNQRNLEGTSIFRGRSSAVLPSCPFAKASMLCGVVALCCAPLAFAGIAGMIFSPFLAIFSLVLAFISKSLIGDPQYGKGGAGLILGAFCTAILGIMIWGGIFFYVIKVAPTAAAQQQQQKPIDPSKVFIAK